MNSTPLEPSTLISLPFWMQLFAFIASSFLIILTIIRIIIQLAKKPKLQFRLTREIFFRITNFEEAIFANGVLVAKNDGILIDNISFNLNKTDDPRKSFPLRIAYFGEKVRGLSPFSEFNFYTTSPISYIPTFMPQRIVYYLAQESYEKEMKKTFDDYNIKIQNENQQFKSQAPSVDPSQKENKTKEFIFKIIAIQTEYLGKIMELVQLEPGQYDLEAEIFYRTKTLFRLKSKRSNKSKISFIIEGNVKENLRAQLISALQVISGNIILAESKLFKFPEYSPIEVKEL